MNKNEFEHLYDNYTHMTLLTSSNKLKYENIVQEMNEIKKACVEILETTDLKSALDSLKIFKSRLMEMEEEVNAILYGYREINDMLYLVDLMISDYYEMDIEIDLYELNGIEKDLLGIKDENDKFEATQLKIKDLNQEIHDKINDLN